MSDISRSGLSVAVTTAAPPSTRLHGRWLLAARVGWLALFLVTVVPFAASLPSYLDMVAHPSPDNAALSQAAARALLGAGISLGAFAWTSFTILSVVVLISLILALLLAWRRSDDWMALLVSLFIILYPISGIGIPQNGASTNPDTALAVMVAILENMPFIIILGVLMLFPSGRFVPRRAWVIFLILLLWSFGLTVLPTLFGGAFFLGYPVAVLTIIACMIYRYRRVSTPTERLQTKWVVGGLIVTLIANQVFWIPTGFTPLGQTLYAPLCYLAYQASFALTPIAFFIALQRHRLYDIDTIINRALVYGSLSAVLVGIYAACVIGTQSLVGAFTSDAGARQQPIVIVATTLLIAALFRPLRARLQAFVDRRFYRRKYDAARTVAAFSATLRQEVDLVTLQAHLLETVEETVQPSHASVWLLTPATPGAPGASTVRDR